MEIVSKKSRYALHGLAYIAAFSDDDPVPFEEILAYLRAYSPRLSLSPGYLGKIFQEVARAGLTESLPGPHGGYRLSRPAEEVPLLDVIEALEGELLSRCCLLAVQQCPRKHCGMRDLIREAEMMIYRYFENETLASLADKMEFPDPATIRAYRRGNFTDEAGDAASRRPPEK